jgi:hypothetical protein
MNNDKYQKEYWQKFASSSDEDFLAKDLNSSWDEKSKSYSNFTEIPEEYIKFLKNSIAFDKVLDFGVGLGRNQKYLKSIFKDVHGFDLPEMINRYKRIAPEDTMLFDDFVKIDNDYSLLYEATVFQHIPPEHVAFYLISLSFKCKYYFSLTRSYNDFLRNFDKNIGGLNMYHLVMSTNSWEPISYSNLEIDKINDETHYYALYKSKNNHA